MTVSVLSTGKHTGLINPHVGSRYNSGSILFIEDFRTPQPGMWNDGVGSATRDTDILFCGLPTLRLDPQGNSSGGATSPGRTEATAGVVTKRRIHENYLGNFGMEMWFRFTSRNLTSNTFFSMSIYNRDGVNAYHSRVWLDPNGNNVPMVARILDGAASNALSGTVGTATPVWANAVTSNSQNGAGTHLYDPTNGSLDKAGGWHYVKMVVDMIHLRYISLKLDSMPIVDLSSYQIDTTATTGFAGMHFSVEMVCSTVTVPRQINVAQVIATTE